MREAGARLKEKQQPKKKKTWRKDPLPASRVQSGSLNLSFLHKASSLL